MQSVVSVSFYLCCFSAWEVYSRQCFRFLLLRTTLASLMVNSPSFSLGAEFKPPMATRLSNSKGLGFPFAVNGFLMLVDEIIIVVVFVETVIPGMELSDTLVSEGRYLLPLYFQGLRQW